MLIALVVASFADAPPVNFEQARILGRGQDLGTIEPGKLADNIILKKDPLQAIAEVEVVIKGGVVYRDRPPASRATAVNQE